MSQKFKPRREGAPAAPANGANKKRKQDQIGSKPSKQAFKKMKLVLPKGEPVPVYTPDYKRNSQIIERELEATKTRAPRQSKWKKVDVDASKFLLNEEAGGFFGLEELDDTAAVLYYNSGDTKMLLQDDDVVDPILDASDESDEDERPKKKKKDAKTTQEKKSTKKGIIEDSPAANTDDSGFEADESDDLTSSREVVNLHKQPTKSSNKDNKNTKQKDQQPAQQKKGAKVEKKNDQPDQGKKQKNANKNDKKAQKPENNAKVTKNNQKPKQIQEDQEQVEEEDNEISEEHSAEAEEAEPVENEPEADPIADEDVESLRASMADWTKLFPEMNTDLLRGLKKAGFMQPTPIQERAITAALRDRKDILGAAQTGSGKTLAFGIPILQHILDLQEKSRNNGTDDQHNELKALILSPTRELAKQIVEHLTKAAKYTSIKIVSVVGGVSVYKQQRLMSRRPDILVGTPGRMWETLNQYDNSLRDLAPNGIRFIVLDEADRMVEFGHYPEVESILDAVQLKIESDETFVYEPSQDNTKKETAKDRKAKFQAQFEKDADDDGDSDLDVDDNNEGDNMDEDGNNSENNEEEDLDQDEEINSDDDVADIDMDDEDNGENNNEEEEENNGEQEEEEDEEMPGLEPFKNDHKTAKKSSIVDHKSQVKHKQMYKKQYFIFSATLTLSVEGRKNIGKPRKRNFNKKKKHQKDIQNRVDILMEMIEFERKVEIIDLTKAGNLTADKLVESRLLCLKEEKDIYLYYFLWKYPGRTLVFVNSIECIRRLTPIFQMLNFQVSSLHANMQQKQRFKNLERFRDSKESILIATDVMARGIDIPNVDHVVHYQIPRNSEIYIHRSGRTARAFSGGFTLLLVDPTERNYYRSICQKVKGVDDLKEFPVDRSYFTAIKKRVSLATRINTKLHAKDKVKHSRDWFKKSAKEADIDLEDDFLSDEDEDDFVRQKAVARDHAEIMKMKFELQALMKQQLMPIGMSGKYYTKNPELLASLDKSNSAQFDLANKKTKRKHKK